MAGWCIRKTHGWLLDEVKKIVWWSNEKNNSTSYGLRLLQSAGLPTADASGTQLHQYGTDQPDAQMIDSRRCTDWLVRKAILPKPGDCATTIAARFAKFVTYETAEQRVIPVSLGGEDQFVAQVTLRCKFGVINFHLIHILK